MKFSEVVDRTLTLEESDDNYPVRTVEASSAGPACITFDNGVQSSPPTTTPEGTFTPGVVVVQVRSSEEAYRIASVATALAQWMRAREMEKGTV